MSERTTHLMKQWRERALATEAEVDDLRARLAKVEALVPCLCSPKSFAANQWHHFPACPRAALANPDAAGEGKA